MTGGAGRLVLHEPEDTGGGVGGGMATLTEEVMEGVVVLAELLLAGLVVKQVFEFESEVVRCQLILDQFFDDQFVHDEVDERDIFYFDETAGDLVRDGAAFITDDLGDAEERGFEGGGPGGDAGGPGPGEEGVGLVADGADVWVGGRQAVIERGFLAGGLGDDKLVVGEMTAGFEHDRELL